MVPHNLLMIVLTIAFAALACVFFLNTRKSIVTGIGRIKTVVCSRDEHPVGYWIVIALSGAICLLSASLAALLGYAVITA